MVVPRCPWTSPVSAAICSSTRKAWLRIIPCAKSISIFKVRVSVVALIRDSRRHFLDCRAPPREKRIDLGQRELVAIDVIFEARDQILAGVGTIDVVVTVIRSDPLALLMPAVVSGGPLVIVSLRPRCSTFMAEPSVC